MMALLVVSDQYGLNPFTKEIYAFPDGKGGIIPMIPVDGWVRIINERPELDAIEFIDAEAAEGEVLAWIECSITRKDRSKPIRVREYMTECKRNTGPWQSHPRRMLRHKALIQAARVAFGFAGIYDPDEGERIREAIDVTPPGAKPRTTAPRAVGTAPETIEQTAGETDGSGADAELPDAAGAVDGRKPVLAADIQFDAAEHRYTVAGKRWPSVTEVLDPLLELDGIPRAVLKAAAEFGTHVHMATDLYDKGRLDEPALDPHLAPYLAGWKIFLRDTGAKVLASEVRVGHPKLKYAGTLDKASHGSSAAAAAPRAARHQVRRSAAHRGPADRRLRRGAPTKFDERYVLQLRPDATYRLTKLSGFDRLVDLPERLKPSSLEKQMTEFDKDPAVLEVTTGIMALEQFAATYQVTTPAQYEAAPRISRA
jgi:hypothetical protein